MLSHITLNSIFADSIFRVGKPINPKNLMYRVYCYFSAIWLRVNLRQDEFSFLLSLFTVDKLKKCYYSKPTKTIRFLHPQSRFIGISLSSMECVGYFMPRSWYCFVLRILYIVFCPSSLIRRPSSVFCLLIPSRS